MLVAGGSVVTRQPEPLIVTVAIAMVVMCLAGCALAGIVKLLEALG